MKLLSAFLGLLLLLQVSFSPYALAATKITATKTNTIEAKLPCNKVGNLLLADGLVALAGNTVEITSKNTDGTNQVQLAGTVFNSDQVGSTFNGWVYLDHGPGIGTLDAAGCVERVDLNDGSKIPGPISGITADSVTAGGRTLQLSQVRAIHSARVFQFHGQAGHALSFTSTCIKATAAGKSSTRGQLTWKKMLIATAVVAIVACAIAIPIACSVHHGGGHHSSSSSSSSNSSSSSSVNLSSPFSSSSSNGASPNSGFGSGGPPPGFP